MFKSPGQFFTVKGHRDASTWINIILLIFSFKFGLISFLFIQLLINLSKHISGIKNNFDLYRFYLKALSEGILPETNSKLFNDPVEIR